MGSVHLDSFAGSRSQYIILQYSVLPRIFTLICVLIIIVCSLKLLFELRLVLFLEESPQFFQ